MATAATMTRRNFVARATGAMMIVGSQAESQTVATPQRVGGSTGTMVTLLFSVTVKEDKAREFHDLAARLTTTTRTYDEGCLSYVFLQQQDAPREYVLYEQWRDQSSLDAHIARLQSMLGPPDPGGRVPKAFLDLCEKTRVVRYQPVA